MAVGPRYVGRVELPWEEGTHRGTDMNPDDVAPVLRESRWSMTGLAADHKFYSAALLTMTGVAADPVSVFWNENNLPIQEAPLVIELESMVFRGLVPPADRLVYACPNHHADRLFQFLDRFGAASATGVYWESLHQRMPLVDWPLVSQLTTMPNRPPVVDVELYGLVGPSLIFHWNPPSDLWKAHIWLSQTQRTQLQPPRPRTLLQQEWLRQRESPQTRRRPFSS